jgi:hypothetical protein
VRAIRWWTPHRAHPDHNRSPSRRTLDDLDAGTQHRAVDDSTEPRYGAVAGAVKPAPDVDHPVSGADAGNRRTDTPDATKNVLRVVDNRLLRGPPG